MSLLSELEKASDIRSLDEDQIVQLADEIRQRIIEVTSKNGGHIGPNLGVVELTMAMHTVFETPKDQFTFDVSHQGYVHKLLTGRNNAEFDKIRSTGGLSGFLNRFESEHDSYGAGHAGTALSAALGMASARDLQGGDEHVVAVLGDAAFTCGITLEALNNITESTQRLIVILNDNKWSIAKNVGAISRYLNELITNPTYNRIHHDLESFLKKVPGGESFMRISSRAKMEAKDFMIKESSLFEKFGLRYLGPIDGHNYHDLVKYLNFCKESTEPILLHINTIKGKGYEVALDNPEKFHGTSPFEIETGKGKPSSGKSIPKYQDVFGDALVEFASADKNIVGITGAMPSGTGLTKLSHSLPDQYFDVGIAEEHAVLFAAGLATKNIRPVCAIYSTFLQRAFDPIIHDVCLQNLPVLFCMDRAGLSPNDGATHHGLFDIAYLRCVPNTVIMQPKDEAELVQMMKTGFAHDGPAFIRYPRGSGKGVSIPSTKEANLLEIGKAETIEEGSEIILWALGTMVDDAIALAEKITTAYGIKPTIINARFAKPLDQKLLHKLANSANLLVTLEDGVVTGGMGSAVLESLQEADIHCPVVRIGWPDHFVDHASSVSDLRAMHELSPDHIFQKVDARWNAQAATNKI